MYGDFSDSEKSNDSATKFEINSLWMLVVVSCVPCVDFEPLQSVLVVEIPNLDNYNKSATNSANYNIPKLRQTIPRLEWVRAVLI